LSLVEDTLVSIGCDYITAIAPDSQQLNTLHSYAAQLFRHQKEIGNNAKPWGLAGFKGWKCGSIEIGTLEGDVIVRMHSECAFTNWRKVVQLSHKISRLDLQATIKVPDGPTRRIDKHRVQARRHSHEHHDKPVVRWTADHTGGYTLYLGARTSTCFGRIYDKFQHTKLDHYRNCIRFEVQYHNHLAKMLAHDLVGRDSPRARIASHVNQFFRSRHVDPKLNCDSSATISCPRPRSDDDRHLAWLRTQVRPSVLRLISRNRGDEVFRALGLIDETDNDMVQAGPYHEHTSKGEET